MTDEAQVREQPEALLAAACGMPGIGYVAAECDRPGPEGGNCRA